MLWNWLFSDEMAHLLFSQLIMEGRKLALVAIFCLTFSMLPSHAGKTIYRHLHVFNDQQWCHLSCGFSQNWTATSTLRCSCNKYTQPLMITVWDWTSHLHHLHLTYDAFMFAVSVAVMSVDLGSEWMKMAIVKPGVPMEIVLNKYVNVK